MPAETGPTLIAGNFNGVLQPPQKVAQTERVREIVDEIHELPRRQRNALVMQEFEGYSNKDVALKLHTSPIAVKKLVSRARTTLREKMIALFPVPWLVRNLKHGNASAQSGSDLAAGIKVVAVAALAAGSITVAANQITTTDQKTGSADKAVQASAATLLSGPRLDPASPLISASGLTGQDSRADQSTQQNQSDGSLSPGTGSGSTDSGSSSQSNASPDNRTAASGSLLEQEGDSSAGKSKSEKEGTHPGKGNGNSKDKDKGKDKDNPGNGKK